MFPVSLRLFFSLNSDDHAHRPRQRPGDHIAGDDVTRERAELGGNATPSLRRHLIATSKPNIRREGGDELQSAMSFNSLLVAAASTLCFVSFASCFPFPCIDL